MKPKTKEQTSTAKVMKERKVLKSAKGTVLVSIRLERKTNPCLPLVDRLPPSIGRTPGPTAYHQTAFNKETRHCPVRCSTISTRKDALGARGRSINNPRKHQIRPLRLSRLVSRMVTRVATTVILLLRTTMVTVTLTTASGERRHPQVQEQNRRLCI